MITLGEVIVECGGIMTVRLYFHSWWQRPVNAKRAYNLIMLLFITLNALISGTNDSTVKKYLSIEYPLYGRMLCNITLLLMELIIS